MQVTYISLYSFKKLCAHPMGLGVTGYTVKPGFSKGLFISNRVAPMSGYQGF